MSNEATILKKPPSQKKSSPKPSVKIRQKQENDTNFFLRDIDMSSVKEALLKELDISKIKESLVDEVKATLLKEIDVSGLKEALVKDIELKDFVGKKSKEVSSTNIEQKIHKEQVNLPAYKYGLIDGYIKENQEILSIYEMIMDYAKNKDFTTLPLMLPQFSKKCYEHFNDEEELYTYMKLLAGSRSEIERKVATEFTKEMKNLSLEILGMLNQSKFIPVNEKTVTGFISEFSKLGEVLNERIEKEETILYPMYENSRQVVDIC